MDSTLTDRLDHIEKWKSYREQKFDVLLDHFGKDLSEEAKTELKGVHSRYVESLSHKPFSRVNFRKMCGNLR